jgi:WD40 repeat protein
LWDGASAKQLRSLDNHTAAVHDIAVRRGQGKGITPWIATCASDRTVRFWQPTIGRLIRFAKLPHPPLALAWSPDGAYVYAATSTGEVIRIDPDTLELQTLSTKLDGWIYCLAVHPEGQSLLLGGERGQIQRVDVSPK